uniref:Uncharacterized protein n=1 Tax=Chelonoidis abingdonii TaxID=106734 RepID=A0A8C0GRY7_CHEAB
MFPHPSCKESIRGQQKSSGGRILKPPGGGSSNLFGNTEEVSSSSRPHRMASSIFGAAEEPQNFPKRTYPPGENASFLRETTEEK